MQCTSEWPSSQLGTRRVPVNTGDGLVHRNGTAFRPTGTTFHSPVVSNAPPRPKPKVLHVAHTVYFRVPYYSYNKPLPPYTAFTDWSLLIEGRCSLLSTNRIFIYTAMRHAQLVSLDTVLPQWHRKWENALLPLPWQRADTTSNNSNSLWVVYHVINSLCKHVLQIATP
jgi:hypothetical protein